MMRLLISLGVCLLTTCLPGQDPQPKKQTVLKISPQTTRIVQPLDDLGFVDYVKAVDEMASRDVTIENNFEVVVRRVLGPQEIPEGMRKEYYRRLGMPIANANFFIDYFDFRRLDQKAETLDEYNRGYDAPWSAEDVPDLAGWLRTVDAQLDAIVRGSQRTRYYTPYVSGDAEDGEEYPRMISMLLPSIQGHRQLARGLRIRANLKISQGDLDAAWNDILSIYRISRLDSQGITLIESLVGIALDGIAFDAAQVVLHSRDLTDDQARRFLADLTRLPRPPSLAEKIDIGERFMGLDALQTLVRQPNLMKTLQMIGELSLIDGPPPAVAGGGPSELGDAATLVVFQENRNEPEPQTGIDWNVTAKMLNGWYDRLVAAAGEEDFTRRTERFAAIEADIAKLKTNLLDSPALMLRVLTGKPNEEVGRIVGDILVSLLLPAINAASQAEYEAVTRLDVLRLAFAAEVYRRERGIFPAELSKLSPDFIDQVPKDRMSGKPLRYNTTNQKLVLYSVGRNGRDDRGRGYRDQDEDQTRGWDDIVIRISRDR